MRGGRSGPQKYCASTFTAIVGHLDGSGAVGSAARLCATCTTSLEELEGLIDMDEVVPEEDELETFEDVADLDMHLE